MRKAIASQQNEAHTIARSVIEALAERLLTARFSRQEEREADDRGVAFLERNGYDRLAAVSALEKLATLGNDHSFPASHPMKDPSHMRLMRAVPATQK